MSALIKAGDTPSTAEVRAFAALRAPVAAQGNPQVEALAELDDKLSAAARQIETLKDQIEQAFIRGKAEGRKVGKAEAEDMQAERTALLKAGVTQAHEQLVASLSALERLAVLIARESLEKLFGQDDVGAERIAALIRQQMVDIERSAVLEIRVSPTDFPDSSARDALAAAVGMPEAVIRSEPELPSGACIMRLRLGTVEVGLNQQWPAIRALLDDLAQPESVP